MNKALFTLLSAPLCLAASQPSIEKLDQIVSSTLEFWGVPGCAVSLVCGNEIILSKGYGLKKLNTDLPIDEHTVFPIASLTKLFTATTLGILVDRKTIQWDSPILGSYPKLKLSDPYATSHLSFRDCLAMRSGMPGPLGESFIYSDALTSDQLLTKKLPKIPFTNGFRSHFAYENLLYLLAIQPFPSWTDFLKKEIFAPLSMKDTLSCFSQFCSVENRSTLYAWEIDHFSEVSPENSDNIAPAAGLFSSAHDMAAFLRLIPTLISPSVLQEIFTPQTTVAAENFLGLEHLFYKDILFPDCAFLDYGFGCFIHDYRGIKMIQVPGLTEGSAPVMAIIPALNLSICILPNAESAGFSRALLFQIIDAHLDKLADWNQRFLNIVKM